MDYGKPSNINPNNASLGISISATVKSTVKPDISVIEKCPECGCPYLTKELVGYATYEGPSLKKAQKRCPICGFTKLCD